MDYCLAATRQGTPCQKPAGWGTDHPGQGRCKLHGGCSPGGPPGNKKAVKTGEYERLLLRTMVPAERRAYRELDTDARAMLDNALRVATIRELRMLQRIAELKTAAEESIHPGMTAVRVEANTAGQFPGDKTVHEGALGQIQAIEEALTRVQLTKAKLIELRHRLQTEEPPEEPEGSGIEDALRAAADEVWDEGEGEDA